MMMGVNAGQVAMAAAGLVYLTDSQARWDAFVHDMTSQNALGLGMPAGLTRANARESAVVLLGLSIAMVGNPRQEGT